MAVSLRSAGRLGFKLAANSNNKALFIACSIVSMAISGAFLYMAQRTIPIGTAYAVWTGIGAIGTLAVGILFFDDPAAMIVIIAAFFICYVRSRHKLPFSPL